MDEEEVEEVTTRRGRGRSTRSKKSPLKSVVSKATSKKPVSKRGRQSRSKKAETIQSEEEEQPEESVNKIADELNQDMKDLTDRYDQSIHMRNEMEMGTVSGKKAGLYQQSDNEEDSGK